MREAGTQCVHVVWAGLGVYVPETASWKSPGGDTTTNLSIVLPERSGGLVPVLSCICLRFLVRNVLDHCFGSLNLTFHEGLGLGLGLGFIRVKVRFRVGLAFELEIGLGPLLW